MAESKVRRENYIVIQGWMITELELKGNELIIYAIIYGFSQTDDQWFTGSRRYLAEWANSTKQSIQKCLNSLVSKGYIEKKENYINGIKFCDYRAVELSLVNKVAGGGQQSCLPSEQSLLGGGQQSCPHNIDIHNLEDNIEENSSSRTPYQQIVDMYHSICVSYPKLKTMSAQRKKTISARYKTYGLEGFKELFEKAEASSWLKSKKNFGFDWLICDNNMAKTLEGKYDDYDKPAGSNSASKFGDLSHLMAGAK